MPEKIHYVYITTNLINGKQYIGDHSTDNLEDGYLGSGRPYLREALKKYGRKNFKREILEFFSTRKEAFEAQEKYIKIYDTLSPNGYNISSRGGYGVASSPLREETKNKISLKLKGKPKPEEFKKRMRGKKPWNTGIKYSGEQKKNLIGRVPWNKGKTNIYSKETLKQISLSKIGKPNPHNEEWNKKISVGKMGFKYSEESKQKMRESFRKNLLKKQEIQ